MRTALLIALLAAGLCAGCAASSPAAPGSGANAPASPAAAAEAPGMSAVATPEPTASPAAAPTPARSTEPAQVRVSGSIVDSKGAPLAGLEVYADSCDTFGGCSGLVEGSTATDGTFEFELREGRWCFSAETPVGLLRFGASGWDYGSDEDGANCLDVSDHINPSISLVVPAGTLVSGRVLLASGRPLAREWLHAFGPGGVDARARTDSKGRFSLRLIPGRYELFAEGPGGDDELCYARITVGSRPIKGLVVGQ